jgi:PPOX class probable F420-dependent enzyme
VTTAAPATSPGRRTSDNPGQSFDTTGDPVAREERGMRRNLRPEDVVRLLEAPKCATLATYRRDGTVLLSPVWHEWRGGGFNVHLGAGGINARLLRRDPRASLVVYDDAPPYAGVELRGEARLTTEDERGALRRLAVRYLGEREGNAYADAATWEGVLLRLEPGELRIWDFVDEYGGR